MLMGYTVHGYKYPCSHCDHGHTMALLVLWPCSHHTKLFPSYSWLSSKATTKEAFHGATNQLLELDVLPSTAPRHPWTHEHLVLHNERPRQGCGRHFILQQPGKNRLGIKLAGVFIIGILFLKWKVHHWWENSEGLGQPVG